MFSHSLHFSTLIPGSRVPSADLSRASRGFSRSTPSAATPRELSAKRQYALRLSVHPQNPGPTETARPGLFPHPILSFLLSTTCNLAARFHPSRLFRNPSFLSFTFGKEFARYFLSFIDSTRSIADRNVLYYRQTFGDGSANFLAPLRICNISWKIFLIVLFSSRRRNNCVFFRMLYMWSLLLNYIRVLCTFNVTMHKSENNRMINERKTNYASDIGFPDFYYLGLMYI